jgi:hypothetical protein
MASCAPVGNRRLLACLQGVPAGYQPAAGCQPNAARFSSDAILRMLWGSQSWLQPAFSRRLPGVKTRARAERAA